MTPFNLYENFNVSIKSFINRFISKKIFQSQYIGSISASWKSINSETYAKEGYMINNTGFRCVDIISKNIASVPLKVKKTSKKEEFFLDDKHPLQKLLNKPNLNKGKDEFISNFVAFHRIAGESFMWANGPENKPPHELWIIPPFKMKVATSEKSMLPLGYTFDNGKTKKTWDVNQMTGQSDILHWHTFNPFNTHRGFSPFTAAAFSVDINNKSSEWNKSLLDNDSRPSGILSTEGNISHQQYKQIKEMMKDYHSGSKTSGNFLMLDGGLKWQQMGLTPKDMDWLTSKSVTATDIASVFGIPNQILGIPGSQTFANYEQARLALWEDTIIPLLDSLVDELNAWLVPKFNEDGLKITYDADKISALEPRRREKWEAVRGADWLTINEKREETDFPRLDEAAADEIYIGAGLLPLGFEAFASIDDDGDKSLIKAWVDNGFTEKQAKEKLRKFKEYAVTQSQK